MLFLSKVHALGCKILIAVSTVGVFAMGYGARHGVALEGTTAEVFGWCLVIGFVFGVAGLVGYYRK